MSPTVTIFALICAPLFGFSVQSATLQDIESTPNLTPTRFARFFNDFEFKFHTEVQAPEAFLASRSGDCDDYAVLAARVLKKRGYTPRLIAVRMPGIVHVVCYVPEANGYLDYNLRGSASGVKESGPEIGEVARAVANSYGAKWSSASEFTFERGAKRLVQTVVHEKQFASSLR